MNKEKPRNEASLREIRRNVLWAECACGIWTKFSAKATDRSPSIQCKDCGREIIVQLVSNA